MNNELAKAWQKKFEEENGREPSMDEFMAAKENDFAMPEDPKKVWVANFEATYGRKPTVDEFNQAKSANFATVPNSVPTTSVKNDTVVPQRMAQQQIPREPMSTKTKVLLGVGLVVLAALGGGYAWGQNHFSKESEASRVATSLASQKATTYATVLKWSDTKKNLSKEEAEPTVRYMKQEKWDSADSIAGALVRNDIPAVKLEETGRNFLVFPRYELVVKPITITAETNQNQLTLKVNGVDEGKVDRSKRMTHRAPGVYVFEATSRIGNKDVPVTESRTITKDETIGLNIEVISFDVESNLKNGDLYIGETKIGTLKNGKYKVKNQPITDKMEVYVAQNLGKQKIESERKELSSSNDHGFLTLDAEGIITESEANSVLTAAMSAVDSYAYDERIPSDMNMFTNGSSNKTFQNFKANIDHNLNNARRTADSIDYAFKTVRSVSQTSETSADFVGEIEVDFYYTSDTDKAKRTSGRLGQTFEITGTLAYDSGSGSWKVDSISDKQPKLHETDNVS